MLSASAEQLRVVYDRAMARTRRQGKVINGKRCLVFIGATSSSGYGSIRDGGGRKGQAINVHRLAWLVRHGPIPAGLCVLHRCDVRPCMEDAHHFLGTKADNNADCIAKGRARHPGHKLTEATVRKIRAELARGDRPPAVAQRHNISPSTVRKIHNGLLWAHVVGA